MAARDMESIMPEAHYSATETDSGTVSSAKLDVAGQIQWLTAVSMLLSVMLALLLLTVTQLGPASSAHTVCRLNAPLALDQSGTSARRLELPNARGQSI